MIKLLEEARKRYLKGTKFRSAYDPNRIGFIKNVYFDSQAGNLFANSGNGEAVYYDGKWAEIISPLYKSKNKKPLKYFI